MDHSPVVHGHHLRTAAVQMCRREKTADSQLCEGERRGTRLGNSLKIHLTVSPRLPVLPKLPGPNKLCLLTF